MQKRYRSANCIDFYALQLQLTHVMDSPKSSRRAIGHFEAQPSDVSEASLKRHQDSNHDHDHDLPPPQYLYQALY
ncbi:hypothetical protein TNCV_1503661 [Trichonephila clavipes]|uniref:Uncharacterized protein n=1 Tax=Trichonephila clavipes TaxID=2585209 RepID=A0A8X6RYI1_TRICX|nr:hypothetical protein TNCV_1503661 [Trichonephila clavipes]